jgi:hypothetical protein
MHFDATRIRNEVMRNEQAYIHKINIRRFGKCFCPSLGAAAFSYIRFRLHDEVSNSNDKTHIYIYIYIYSVLPIM